MTRPDTAQPGEDILSVAARWLEEGRHCALATVVETAQRRGLRALDARDLVDLPRLYRFASSAHARLETDGDDAVIIVIDRDGPKNAGRIDSLKRGRASLQTTVPSALGVAQEMVESWLLGDPGAWRRAFGPDVPPLPPQPEEETKAGGSPRYAKRVFRELVATAQPDTRAGWLELYTTVAHHSDWEALEGNCPKSFAPFAREVRCNVGPVFGVRDRQRCQP